MYTNTLKTIKFFFFSIESASVWMNWPSLCFLFEILLTVPNDAESKKSEEEDGISKSTGLSFASVKLQHSKHYQMWLTHRRHLFSLFTFFLFLVSFSKTFFDLFMERFSHNCLLQVFQSRCTVYSHFLQSTLNHNDKRTTQNNNWGARRIEKIISFLRRLNCVIFSLYWMTKMFVEEIRIWKWESAGVGTRYTTSTHSRQRSCSFRRW
jgi:hypothetical protein